MVSSISPARMHRKAELIQVPSKIPTPSAIMQHPCSCLFRHTQKTPPAQSMQGVYALWVRKDTGQPPK